MAPRTARSSSHWRNSCTSGSRPVATTTCRGATRWTWTSRKGSRPARAVELARLGRPAHHGEALRLRQGRLLRAAGRVRAPRKALRELLQRHRVAGAGHEAGIEEYCRDGDECGALGLPEPRDGTPGSRNYDSREDEAVSDWPPPDRPEGDPGRRQRPERVANHRQEPRGEEAPGAPGRPGSRCRSRLRLGVRRARPRQRDRRTGGRAEPPSGGRPGAASRLRAAQPSKARRRGSRSGRRPHPSRLPHPPRARPTRSRRR